MPPDLLFDLDGNPRIVDGDGDLVEAVDMGAYEYQGPGIFSDGFETGDTSAWSATVP